MNPIGLNTRVERNPDMLWTEVDGETVMMSIERSEYFGVGGVGTRLWELLATPRTAAELCARIVSEFEVDAATCEADVTAFLGELVGSDVIRPVSA